MNLNWLFPILTLCLTYSCASAESEANEQEPFTVDFTTEHLDSNHFLIEFTIRLDSSNYYVSPHSSGHHQRLQFSLFPSRNFKLIEPLKENPIAQYSFDQISEKSGHFVYETTHFSQELSIMSDSSFSTPGLIWIEMRPTCQPYEITFQLNYVDEQLYITDVQIKTSNYPNFEDNKRLDNLPEPN